MVHVHPVKARTRLGLGLRTADLAIMVGVEPFHHPFPQPATRWWRRRRWWGRAGAGAGGRRRGRITARRHLIGRKLAVAILVHLGEARIGARKKFCLGDATVAITIGATHAAPGGACCFRVRFAQRPGPRWLCRRALRRAKAFSCLFILVSGRNQSTPHVMDRHGGNLSSDCVSETRKCRKLSRMNLSFSRRSRRFASPALLARQQRSTSS